MNIRLERKKVRKCWTVIIAQKTEPFEEEKIARPKKIALLLFFFPLFPQTGAVLVLQGKKRESKPGFHLTVLFFPTPPLHTHRKLSQAKRKWFSLLVTGFGVVMIVKDGILLPLFSSYIFHTHQHII